MCATQMQHNFYMAKYFVYIKKDYDSKSGYTPLYVRYNYDRTKRTLISTRYSIKFQHWDDKKKCVKRACPEYDEIEVTVNKIYLRLSNILDYANENDIEPTVDFVLKELAVEREYEQKQARTDLFALLDKYVEEKTPFVSKDQVKDYRTLKKHLTTFKKYSSQPISFRNLNMKFYKEFMNYLFYEAVKTRWYDWAGNKFCRKSSAIVKRFCKLSNCKRNYPDCRFEIFQGCRRGNRRYLFNRK
ncbi:hypothetical protein JCM30204_33510 [Dysgonomonas termitidis]